MSSKLYENFYPKWNGYYTRQLAANCSEELKRYKNLPTSSPEYNGACINTALCMMDHSVKNVESQTASTGVLLGLLPSILSILGSSPVELGLLSTSRPILSLLLALAAPVVNPIRLFDYVNPKDILRNLNQGVNITTRRRGTYALITVVQFVFAILAVGNVTIVAFELYSKAYSVVIACSGRYQIFIWNVLVVALWLAGFLCLLSRSRFEPIRGGPALAPQSSTSWSVRLCDWVKRWPGNEFSGCVQHEDRRFYWNPENRRYYWISQALTLGTVAHIFYGTAILSGYQFIAPSDALIIVVRYVASAWISRLILRYELASLSARTTVQ